VRAPLAAGAPVSAGIRESDIPRWVEVLGAGADIDGSVTITGDAAEGTGVSETVALAARRSYLTSVRTSATATSITDDTQHWMTDEWRNTMVQYHGPDNVALITGNDENTLFGDFPADPDYWQYVIFRQLGNSYDHWQRITSVSTTDLDLAEVSVSTPHDFDTADATGAVRSFSPHTDGRDDQYTKRPDYGQWTIEVEPDLPAAFDVFLHVITMGEPGATAPGVAAAPAGASATAAVVGDRVVVFANGTEPLTAATVTLPAAGAYDLLCLDLRPSTAYHVMVAGLDVTVAEGAGGTEATSSAMGTVAFAVAAAK
jgi:hypothetical protein